MLSTVAALTAAALFAVTTNLQRAAASAVPAHGNGPVRLVRALVTNRRWLFGGGLGLVALSLHALALARGSVTVVQSVMATGLVVALSLEALRERRRLLPHELGGAMLVVTGVVAVATVGEAGRSWPGAPRLAWAVCVAVVAATWGAVIRSRHEIGGDRQARILAAAGGACLTVDAVFLQRVAEFLPRLAEALPLGRGIPAVLTAHGPWPRTSVAPSANRSLPRQPTGRCPVSQQVRRGGRPITPISIGPTMIVTVAIVTVLWRRTDSRGRIRREPGYGVDRHLAGRGGGADPPSCVGVHPWASPRLTSGHVRRTSLRRGRRPPRRA